MRKVTCAAMILMGLLACVVGRVDAADAYKGSKSSLHVYLLIGQSNMAGRAPYTEEESAPVDGCYLLNGEDEWEPAKNPLNIYSTIRKGPGMQKMNPGYGFVQAMREHDKAVSIGLVVNAKGGTKIEQWQKGTRFYDEAVRRAKEAQKKGTLKGILWHQGESDSGSPDGYLEALAKLVSDLRKELGSPELPFVAGQIRQYPQTESINQQIARLPDEVKQTAYVSSDELTSADRWHFDAKSMKQLGERYAEQMRKLQTK